MLYRSEMMFPILLDGPLDLKQGTLSVLEHFLADTRLEDLVKIMGSDDGSELRGVSSSILEGRRFWR